METWDDNARCLTYASSPNWVALYTRHAICMSTGLLLVAKAHTDHLIATRTHLMASVMINKTTLKYAPSPVATNHAIRKKIECMGKFDL